MKHFLVVVGYFVAVFGCVGIFRCHGDASVGKIAPIVVVEVGKEKPQPPSPPQNKWICKREAIRQRLAEGKIIFSDDFDRPELGGNWIVEEGTWQSGRAMGKTPDGVIGTNGKKYPDTFLWTKQSFKGDLSVEFEAECLAAIPQDINFVINGQAPNYPPPEKPLYLFGLGGWGNTMSGVERAPDYKWKMLTGLFTIEKNKIYKVLAGRLGSKFYLFVDGKLIVETADPNPLPNEGQFAFHVYESTVRYSKLRLRAPEK
ncbi:MAG: hypothetical protein V1899_01675 [Planctomycetota bacterium]